MVNSFLLLVFLVQFVGMNGGFNQFGEVEAFHKFHVATGRLGIEKNIVISQTRFFKDDLQETLRVFSRDSNFRLDASARTDSLFMAYFERHFVVSVEDVVLRGRIVGSGEDVEGKEAVWWYAVQYDARTSTGTMTIRNTLLFEQYDDQKNILKVRKFPSERSDSYFFDEDETEAEFGF